MVSTRSTSQPVTPVTRFLTRRVLRPNRVSSATPKPHTRTSTPPPRPGASGSSGGGRTTRRAATSPRAVRYEDVQDASEEDSEEEQALSYAMLGELTELIEERESTARTSRRQVAVASSSKKAVQARQQQPHQNKQSEESQAEDEEEREQRTSSVPADAGARTPAGTPERSRGRPLGSSAAQQVQEARLALAAPVIDKEVEKHTDVDAFVRYMEEAAARYNQTVKDPIQRVYNEVNREFPKTMQPTKASKGKAPAEQQQQQQQQQQQPTAQPLPNARKRKAGSTHRARHLEDDIVDSEDEASEEEEEDDDYSPRARRRARSKHTPASPTSFAASRRPTEPVANGEGSSHHPRRSTPATPSAHLSPTQHQIARASGALTLRHASIRGPTSSPSPRHHHQQQQQQQPRPQQLTTTTTTTARALPRRRRPWSKADEEELERGLYRYQNRPKRWRMILDEGLANGRFEGRNNVDLKDKARQMKESRARSGLQLGGFRWAVDRRVDE
ncbi:hypothetical protein DFJ77DRAFT_58962 [Powellomyces hirtus]|nr:hypothetical protein DFJ77DRAFT_58962 [Powellomyces hirtus]